MPGVHHQAADEMLRRDILRDLGESNVSHNRITLSTKSRCLLYFGKVNSTVLLSVFINHSLPKPPPLATFWRSRGYSPR